MSNGKANITVTAGDGSGKKSVCQVNVITKVNHMEITSSTGLFTFSKSLKVTAQSNADASNKNFKYEIVAPLGASYMPSDYLTINSKTGQIKSKVNVEKPIYFMVRALALDGSNMIAEHEIILVKKTNGLNIFPKNVTLFTGMGSTPIELTGTQNTIGFDGYKVTVSNKKVVTAYIKDVNAEVTEGTRLIITPVAKGTATIKLKALDGTGKTQTIKVTVNNPVRELNISSKNGTDTITLGKSITLKANVNKDATNKKVKWELVNPMDSDFAKLTQSGKLTLKSIPIKGNSVTVKATTKDGTNISDTFTVNIAEFCAKSINVYDSTGVEAKKFKLSTSACPNGTLVTNVNVSVTLDGNYVDRYRKVVAISSDEYNYHN